MFEFGSICMCCVCGEGVGERGVEGTGETEIMKLVAD